MKNKKQILKVELLISLFYLVCTFLFFINTGEAKMRPITYATLTLLNEPKVGEIAVLRLTVTAPMNLDLENAKIDCFLLEGLEFINEKGYKVNFERYGSFSKEALETWGNRVIFYSGQIKRGEKKEFIFKVRIPDGKKYFIYPAGGDPLEIDLGDPEPPEWNPKNIPSMYKEYVNGKRCILTRIKQVEDDEVAELKVNEDALPPIRTEFKIRTKDKPDYDYYREIVLNPQPGKDTSIPVRYLVYTEEGASNLRVTLRLPQGLEFIKDKEGSEVSILEDGRTEILLYSGPMHFKQCRAFYFKVKPRSQEEYPIKASAELTTSDGKKLLKEDNLVLSLKPKF